MRVERYDPGDLLDYEVMFHLISSAMYVYVTTNL